MRELLGIIGGYGSLSPLMHRACFRELGLDYEYVEFNLKDLKRGMEGVRGLGVRGLSVTVPYKREVMEYMDWVEEEARLIGAVNTVVNDGGYLRGYNTDGMGAYEAIRNAGYRLEGKNVIILGNGGSARAILYVLLKSGGVGGVVVVGRSLEKLRILKEEVAREWGEEIEVVGLGGLRGYDWEGILKRGDIVIHTTPLGGRGYEGEVFLGGEYLSARHMVFDIVYDPRKTRLLEYAMGKGAGVIFGYKMLVEQGLGQFKLWTGEDGDRGVMDWVVKGGGLLGEKRV